MSAKNKAVSESLATKSILILVAILYVALILLLPLASVFGEAFSHGLNAFKAAIVEPDALAAIKLTLTVAAISVPINMVCGVAAAWAITKWVLEMPLVVPPSALAITIVGGALGTLALGLAAGFAALGAKPAARLRNP